MREIKLKLFSYRELSEESKERAYQEWLEDEHNIPGWADDNTESLKRITDELMIPIKSYSLSYSKYPDRNDHITLEASYYDACNGVNEIKNIMLDRLEDYKIPYYMDDVLYEFCIKNIKLLSDKYSLNDFIDELIKTFTDAYYDDNRQHYSVENYRELAEANDYEYLIDGDLY